jgi:hypothetical protein
MDAFIPFLRALNPRNLAEVLLTGTQFFINAIALKSQLNTNVTFI